MTGACENKCHDEEVASSKNKTKEKKKNSRLECKNRYPIYYQNGGKTAKIDTLSAIIGGIFFQNNFFKSSF